jgi:hypothetical protein
LLTLAFSLVFSSSELSAFEHQKTN